MRGPIRIWIHLTSQWHKAILQNFIDVDLFIEFNKLGEKINGDFPFEVVTAKTITETGFLGSFYFA